MKGARLAFLCLFFGAPALANYVYDPADLPKDFECYEGPDQLDCEAQRREAAWYEVYGSRYDVWFHQLLYRPGGYFSDSVAGPSATFDGEKAGELGSTSDWETDNLVDAVYSVALRRYTQGWAFAINEDAQYRFVRLKTDVEISEAQKEQAAQLLPTSLAETAHQLSIIAAFEEADLTQCRGAITQLLAFPGQQGGKLWSEKELSWMPGHNPRERDGRLLVAADGDGVIVRARGVEDQGAPVRKLLSSGFIVYDQSNGGVGYDWALAMEKVARPCLTQSEARPPWERYRLPSEGDQAEAAAD